MPVLIYGQVSNKTNFNRIITTAKGDLNKDKLPDSVIVLQDIINEYRPYRLQVFFKTANNSYKLIVQNDSAIEVELPNGKDGYLTGTEFSHIDIKAGVLTLSTQLLRGSYEHKFRFQNGYFALIGFMETYSDGQGIMTATDFNLSTGLWVEVMQRYDTDKIISNTKKKIKINPLPDLKKFTPHSTTLY
ncbi:MAG: hypothetical protein JNM14_15150 [Ferruginibacter sp.]|nr:hypothetical protein [Ferruginibacter sp.]